ncbi:MAG: hypothetical protein ABR562_08560 [Thermoplasmatota archaeon]
MQPVERLPSHRKRKGAPEPADPRPPNMGRAGGPPPAGYGPAAEAHFGALRPFINLSGDYRFLRAGFWALVDAELNGVESSPTPIQAVTAQNAAACLLVARHNGIETVQWKVARRPEDVEPLMNIPLERLQQLLALRAEAEVVIAVLVDFHSHRLALRRE